MNESVVDASADNGGSVATDMDTSPKAVMTALQALRKDVTELKRSSLGMDVPHDRKRQKPEASSGTSDPRRGDLASLARRNLSVPTADVKDMELRISEFVRVHGGGHAIKRNGNASQTSLRLKCVAPGCQFKAAATRSRVGGSMWKINNDECGRMGVGGGLLLLPRCCLGCYLGCYQCLGCCKCVATLHSGWQSGRLVINDSFCGCDVSQGVSATMHGTYSHSEEIITFLMVPYSMSMGCWLRSYECLTLHVLHLKKALCGGAVCGSARFASTVSRCDAGKLLG